jgi:ABC-type cobalamin transport system permease subunit
MAGESAEFTIRLATIGKSESQSHQHDNPIRQIANSDLAQTRRLMKPYIVVSGSIFFLIVVAHALRLASEGAHIALEPSFAFASAAAIGMCIWACVLFRRNT